MEEVDADFLRVAEGSDCASPHRRERQRACFQTGRRVRPSTQPDPHFGQTGARPGRARLRSGRAGRPPRVERLQAKLVERLQTKLVQKNEVIAELMQEHVQLKKGSSGGSACRS